MAMANRNILYNVAHVQHLSRAMHVAQYRKLFASSIVEHAHRAWRKFLFSETLVPRNVSA